MQPISVSIVDEHGNELSDAVTFVDSFLPEATDSRFQVLRFVDPYGDTTFNHAQVRSLLIDLELLDAHLPASRSAIAGIQSLCQECLRSPHQYIKFLGN